MTDLAPLFGWDETAHSLHRAAQPLGALRMFLLDRVPNYLELSLVIEPDGLSTGMLSGLGEVRLDFRRAVITYHSPAGDLASIPLAGHTQASLVEALLATLDVRKLLPGGNERATRTDALLTALEARGHPFTPKRDDLAAESPLHVNPHLAGGYMDTLYRIFTATARFRARLNGSMTPVVVWPEHFDLSFLWFATERADDQFPHMNFGFAPFSDDIRRPYLYAYAYPMPSGFQTLPLPPRARWHTDGWQGLVFPYDELVEDPDPEVRVEDLFNSAYRLLSPELSGTGRPEEMSSIPVGSASSTTER